MRCYEHQSTEAIGVCRGCGKGLCEECCTDTGVGLACGPACDGPVRSERAVLVKATQVYSGGHVFTTAIGALFAVPSGLFALGHLVAGDIAAAVPWLPFTAMGVLTIAMGRYSRLRRSAIGPSRARRPLAERASERGDV